MSQTILDAVHAIRRERYPGSDSVLVAGSLVRGEGTAYSDLDLVVVYSTLPAAYRESFRFGTYPVEAFVHDPNTLEYFFTQVDRPSGIAALPNMVSEGVEIPGPTELTRRLKNRAVEILAEGPPPLSIEDEQRLRYLVSDVLDDLRGVRGFAETIAVGSQLFEALANYYFRSHGFWSACGKAIPNQLARRDASLASRYAESFEALFRTGDGTLVIAIAEEILEPKGGLLFEGYRSEAPANWRTT
jgi:nucleotidyltransferase-like protein